MRTSITHPLQIAEISAGPGLGKIGLTFCPGKQQQAAATGSWDRDLGLDIDTIARLNAAALVTLIEQHEIARIGVAALGQAAADHHLIWHHLPIRDVGIPDESFEQSWQSAGAELRAILRDGANVLVHCKGGLGRAGLVAARLLIELGLAPGRAIEAVRAVRPGAIETRAQLEYVLNLEAQCEPRPDRSSEASADRALGAMLGLAIGDALGTTLEFTRRDSHAPLADMVGGGPFHLKPGQWTDDTAMALALMDSLIAHPRLDETDLMPVCGLARDRRLLVHRPLLRHWCHHPHGAIPVQAQRRSRCWFDDPASAGNGSLMRLAPVAIRPWRDRPALRDVAARQSRTTHGAPEAVDACIAYAGLLADAIAGMPRAAATAYAGAIAAFLAGSWRGKPRDGVRSSGYVAHSLEAALWCVGRTGTFRDAVLLAANLGEDADTTAAITGQLAGALYGASGIPQGWKHQLAWGARITATAQQLFAAGRME